MLKETRFFAETTLIDPISRTIDDALRSLQIAGALLLREAYTPPWSVAIPQADHLAELLGIGPDTHVVAFHLVEFGHCEIALASGERLLIQAGEMVICFAGEAHRLLQGDPVTSQPIESLLSGELNLQRPALSGRAAGTSLLCGVFMLNQREFNPLFSALPPLLHTTLSRQGELHNLSGVARLMAEEIDRRTLGSGYILERLLEILCAEAVRAHIESTPDQQTSWFRGIKDPVVGRAIAAIHEQPGSDWSVSHLAASVAMSPSRFAARFSEAIGESPIAYLTKWRMTIACRELSDTQQSIERIANNLGYESPAAFSRAFKKQIGVAPAVWRTKFSS